MPADTGLMTVEVIPADSLHWPLLRALTQLPVPGDMPSVSGWLAMLRTADGSQRPVGAGLLRIAGRESAAWLAVAPAWRRQGVARQLSQVAARHAAAQGAGRIATWQGVCESAGRGLCADLGMRVANTLSYFETTLANAEKFFGQFHQRMLARGRVPTDLQVLHGSAVPWRHFDALLVQEFGAAMAARLGRIAGYGLARHEWASALMDKGRPVAVTLCSVLDDCVSHDAYLVMPEYRLGWAHITCKYLAARDLRQHFPGIERYVFSSADRHADTRKAATRSMAQGLSTRLVRQEQWFEIDIRT